MGLTAYTSGAFNAPTYGGPISLSEITSPVRASLPATSYTPANSPWVAWIRASDISGADGTPLTNVALSSGTASNFTGTATLRTGSNGINNKNAIQFNGSTNLLASTTGGAQLLGDFYTAIVVEFSSTVGFQNIISWGDASGDGKNRAMLKSSTPYPPNNGFFFIGQNADVISNTLLSSATPYFLELSSVNGIISLFINGLCIAVGNPSLIAYSSTVLGIGQSTGGRGLLNGLVSEVFFSSGISVTVRNNLRSYINSTYGISINNLSGISVLPVISGITVGGEYIQLTGGTGLAFSNQPALSVNGALSAYAPNAEHMLSNNWQGQNTASIWNWNSLGFSAIRFLYVGEANGQEMGAFGFAFNQEPWGAASTGSVYLEASDFNTPTNFGVFRIVQTQSSGIGACLRMQFAENGDIVFYRQTAGVGTATITIKESGALIFNTLPPTSDPHVLGEVYTTAGAMMISAG